MWFKYTFPTDKGGTRKYPNLAYAYARQPFSNTPLSRPEIILAAALESGFADGRATHITMQRGGMAQHKPKTGTIVIAIILAAVFGLSFGIGSRIAYPPVRQTAVRYMLSHHTSNTNKQPVKSTDSIDLFIGDSTAQGATVDASKRWTKLFSDNDHAVERNYAIRGTGYVTGDQKQISFPYQYKKAVEELGNARKQVKRFFVVGFVNDTPSNPGVEEVAGRETEILKATAKDFPNAQIIVIPEIVAPSSLNAMRAKNADRVKYGEEVIAAAHKVDGTIVADSCFNWLKDQEGTVASYNTHPNEKGHAIVAQKVEQLLNATNKPVGQQ